MFIDSLELCHICKGFVSYLYVTILPCILLTRQQHILTFLCVYFFMVSVCVYAISLQIHIISIDQQLMYSINFSPPGFPGPFYWQILRQG
jgi:hypothetical protein